MSFRPNGSQTLVSSLFAIEQISYHKMHFNRTFVNRFGTPTRYNPLPWFLGASEYTLILEDMLQAFCDTPFRLVKVD